jgi:cytochrome c biogenesis protein CcdA
MKIYITILLFVLFGIVTTKNVHAADRTVVYFKEVTCLVCQELVGYADGPAGEYTPETDYIKKMEDQGITVLIYDILSSTESNDLFKAYNVSYGISSSRAVVPIIFVGDQYFNNIDDIIEAVDNNTVFNLSSDPLLDITIIEGGAFDDLKGFAGFIAVLGAGLLDGVNPCAIAMLLLFVSLLGFTEKKKILILVSITYIFALFLSYLLIGVGLLNILNTYADQAEILNNIINWFIFILVSFLFLLNMYDFVVTRNEDYSKVKNQLPKWVQKYNKVIIKKFTNLINDEDNKKGIASVLVLTFVLGLTLSVTELVCTGQIYVAIVNTVRYEEVSYAYFLLVSYNIMFVIPLIIIAVIAIRGKGVISTSNFIREHLHIIKILNALLFLIIAVYFYFRIF